MNAESLLTQGGRVTRIIDRVKRPLFIGCFIAAFLGLFLGQMLLFAGGTLGFSFVAVVHLFMRRSNTPLLGNYLGLGRYLRVTRHGKVLLGLTLIIGLTAINARINLLLIVLGMLLGVVLISGVLSENSLRRLSARLYLPSTAYAGIAFPARLTVQNAKKRFPSYSVELDLHFEGKPGTLVSRTYVLKVPAQRTITLEHLLSIPVRGRTVVRRLRLGTRFPFGLFEKWSYVPVEAEMLLYPRLGRIPGRLIPSSDAYRNQGARKVLSIKGKDEFWGIREYREGDNPRLIHWRSSARLGKRLVKEYHRQESQNVCILMDAHVPAGDDALDARFETAVSFAATLAKHLLDQDYRVFFAAYGQELVRLKTDRGARQIKRVLTALAEIASSPEKTFDHLVSELDPRSTADAVVVGVLLDETRERSARAMLQQQRTADVRLFSVDSPAFAALFVPPASEDDA